MHSLAFRVCLLAVLCFRAAAQKSFSVQYRWAYRNPLSITNASATDSGLGSLFGTVNSLSNHPQQGGLALRYSHGGTFATLPNGSIAAIWQASPLYWEGSAKQAAYWSLSDDSGETWGPATLIYALPKGPLWGPVIHVQDDAVWLFFSGTAPAVCQFPFDGSGNMAWPPGGDLQVVKSLDNGQTWGKPTVISPTSMNGGSGKLGVGRLVVNRAGHWLLPFWRERSGNTTCWGKTLNNYTGVPGVYESKDRGVTWRLLTDIVKPSSKNRTNSWLIENAIAPYQAGNASGLLQIFRANTSRVWHSLSLDDGATWSPAQPSKLPAPDTKSDVAALPDGSLVVAFNNNTSSRLNLTVARSTDGGSTWRHLATVDTGSGQFSYPSIMYINSTGEVAVVYSVWHNPTNATAAVVQLTPASSPAKSPASAHASAPQTGPPEQTVKPAALLNVTNEKIETAGRRLSQLRGSRKLLLLEDESVLRDGALGEGGDVRAGRELLQVPYNQGAWGRISYGIRVAYFDLDEALEMQLQ